MADRLCGPPGLLMVLSGVSIVVGVERKLTRRRLTRRRDSSVGSVDGAALRSPRTVGRPVTLLVLLVLLALGVPSAPLWLPLGVALVLPSVVAVRTYELP